MDWFQELWKSLIATPSRFYVALSLTAGLYLALTAMGTAPQSWVLVDLEVRPYAWLGFVFFSVLAGVNFVSSVLDVTTPSLKPVWEGARIRRKIGKLSVRDTAYLFYCVLDHSPTFFAPKLHPELRKLMDLGIVYSQIETGAEDAWQYGITTPVWLQVIRMYDSLRRKCQKNDETMKIVFRVLDRAKEARERRF